MSSVFVNGHFCMIINQIFNSTLFKNKTVVITGGGSGIGFGIAEVFASLGANIAICGRTQDKLDKSASKLLSYNIKILPKVADVRDFKQMSTFFDAVENELGPCDTVIAGAAGNFLCPAKDLSAKGFRTVIDIDLNGTFNTALAAYEQLKEQSGNLIMISAPQAFIPFEFQAHAGAAKAGVEQLVRQLALEWGRDGIRTNSIIPGPIEGTEGLSRLTHGPLHKTLADTIPLGRFGQLQDIGYAAAYLASPLASYVTGTFMIVDGGQYLNGTGIMNQATKLFLDTKKKHKKGI